MAPKTPHKVLHEIKRHLDNGFNGKQTAVKLGVSESIVSKVRKGDYGLLPKFPSDLKLNIELRKINLNILYNKKNINR